MLNAADGASATPTMQPGGVPPQLLIVTVDSYQAAIALIAPTSAIPAPRIDIFHPESALLRRADAFAGARTPNASGEPVNLVTTVLRFTAPFNITGQPALALPIGLSSEGLPLSMQIIGRPFDEVSVFQVAAAYEEARGPLPRPKV